MLRLKNICKSYKIGKDRRKILDDITVDFNSHELVFILGPSGSGKSTLLNIISGNLRCDSGEIWLDNLCVSNFKDYQYNAYRKNMVSNIFQDYNLIENLSVWDNIMISYNGCQDKATIRALLKQLNIYDKRRISVSRLSGGEKQRVAIARALVNNPKIVLADEPTGALDSANGIQVMEILKMVSKKRLVIVVSHDVNLANKYASRIINIKDGKCNNYPCISEEYEEIKLKRDKFSLFKIIKLAFKNTWIKKGRTLFTALAISLGFISMFLVLNLSYNFNDELGKLEKDIVSLYPISIYNQEYDDNNLKRDSKDKIIFNGNRYMNKINREYLDYLASIKEISYMTYIYDMNMPILSDKYKFIDNKYMKVIPNSKYINDNYEIIYGRNVIDSGEVLLLIDSNNNVSGELLKCFDITDDIEYSDIIGRKIKIISNNDYFIRNGEYFVIRDNYLDMYNNSDMELTLVGIVKEKEMVFDTSGLLYDKSIDEIIIDRNSKSEIVISQLDKEYNVLGTNDDKYEMLSFLGYKTLPIGIDIYVNTLDDHDKVIRELDKYNNNHDKVIYTDLMKSNIEIVKDFVKIISVVLIMFSLVATFVAALMIGILTSIRVLERKKEIGIIRSLGASKGNIINMFNIENIIMGIISFIISLILIKMINNPINMLLNNLIGVNDVFKIRYDILFMVFGVNLIIVIIAGIIPSIKASRLETIKCIYNR